MKNVYVKDSVLYNKLFKTLCQMCKHILNVLIFTVIFYGSEIIFYLFI